MAQRRFFCAVGFACCLLLAGNTCDGQENANSAIAKDEGATFSSDAGQESSTSDTRHQASAKVGSILGTVTYKADAKRRWRYGRYYVNSETRELRGALISLDSPALRKKTAAGEPATVVMDQKDLQFIPETMAIQAGDRIRFTNSDPGTHNVSTTAPLHPFNISLGSGEEMVETFTRAGGVRQPIVLGCIFHSQMRAWIYVFNHPYYQLTTKAGGFRLANVPAGEYRLEIVHPAGALYASRKIRVEAGREHRVDWELSPDDLIGSK